MKEFLNKTEKKFGKIATKSSHIAGSPYAFIGAISLVIGWAISGPIFKFSETWQLFINTGTTITTFLMLFLVQNSQNRDNAAIHIKLDELINVIQEADSKLTDTEDKTQTELEDIKKQKQNEGN